MDSTNPPPGASLPDSRFSVILVEPQYRDNVGHTARAMLNFGVGDLVLVNAGEVDHETRVRAVHAQAVLDHARRFPSLREAKKEFDHLVGFAARISTLDKAHLRMSEPLEKVARRLDEMPGKVGLVFGREDFGLSNEDVEECDILCTIPTSPSYRSMNLSHAVSVALYEMSRTAHTPLPYLSMATSREKEVLFATFHHLTGVLRFRDYKRNQMLQMFRRVIGRSGLSSWEYHRLMGVFSRSLKVLKGWPVPGIGDIPEEPDEPADEGPAGGPPGRQSF